MVVMRVAVLLALAGIGAGAGLQEEPKKKEIEVAVDSRMLLVTTAVWLATDGKFYGKPVDGGYAAAVRKHFRPHLDHRAIRTAAKLTRRGFSYDAPVGWILHYGALPDLKERVPLSAYHIRRGGSREALDDFAAALREFAEDADFEGFVRSQKRAHDAFADRVREVLDAKGGVKRLEVFFGESRDSYTLMIAPLVGPQNFGASVERDIFQIFNPAGYRDRESLRTGVADMVYHEFGHSFCNPIVDAMKDRVDACGALFDPVAEKMRRQAYKDWGTCMREHFVRASAARMIRGERGKRAGAQQVAQDFLRGFVYLPPLYRLLGEYEKNREQYPSLSDFAPRMMEEIEKISRTGADAYLESLPFADNINTALLRHKDRLVFVTPGKGKTADYVRAIAGRIFPKAKIVTADEAMKMEAGKHVFVVYGTPGANRFLAQFAEKLPFRVEEDGLTLEGRKVEGKRLRLIAACANPENPRLPMIVYTATSEDLIPDINNVFHGPTGYVVAGAGGKVYEKGFFTGYFKIE